MKKRLVWLLLCVIWGSTWYFIKLGLRDLPPISFAGIRFSLAALILLGLVLVKRSSIPHHYSDWVLISLTGVMIFTLNYGLVFWAGQYVPSGLASVLQATVPIFGLFIANFYLSTERITRAKVWSALLGLSGVILIFENQLRIEGHFALLGSFAIVLGAFSGAYANVLVKLRGRRLDPSVLALGQMTVGMCPLLVSGIVIDGSPIHLKWTWMAVAAVLYLACIGSVIAFILYYWLIKQMDVTKVMMMGLVTPLITVTLGMTKLNERPSWRAYVGGLAILIGTGLILMSKGRTKDTTIVEQDAII